MDRRVNFTAARVAAFVCPAGKLQAFFWDAEQPGLGLRVTATGARAYIFQGWLGTGAVRVTIGSPEAWALADARKRAAELKVDVDKGVNPNERYREQQQAKAEAKRQEKAKRQREALTLADAWSAYLEERRPHWGERNYRDHVNMAQAGTPSKRRGEVGSPRKAAPLAELMPLPLAKLDAPIIEAWAAKEGKARPTRARLAWRLLRAFLNWCAEHPEFQHIVPALNPAKTKRTRANLGSPGRKNDVLTSEQLPAWFEYVRQIQNPVIAAYLQILLLTGARPGEVLGMRWNDINWQWRSIAIRDKVEGKRMVPLTPYVAHLLTFLPRRSEWVFSSTSSASGQLSRPHTPHAQACTVAGIDGLTLHGLRRSFSTLTEWLEVPAGVVAQIMGHKPSATAEKHYKVRPLDLLRVHHERIEAWILEQAGVQFAAEQALPKLRIVDGISS